MAEERKFKRECKQKGCTVATDGKCFESLEPDACPHHFYLEEDLDQNESEGENKAMDKENTVPLFSGRSFTLKETETLTNAEETNRIFIIGESGSGKTTLLATLYDLFQLGPIQDILFSGSYTQIGFEERCHLSRQASGAAVPETEKTASKEFAFLHLAVKKKSELQEDAVHLLISDISGEMLKSARNSSSAILELTPLKSASKVIYMMDGERLSDQTQRAAVIFNAMTFLKRSLEDKILGNFSDLKIVVSKWDKLINEKTFHFHETIVKEFDNNFESKFSSLTYSKIASRPKLEIIGVEFGFGLYALLEEWMAPQATPTWHFEIQELSVNSRWFDNYNLRKNDG